MRKKERRRYALFHGSLAWGVPTCVLWSAVMPFVTPQDLPFFHAFLKGLTTLPLWLLGGYVWGWCMWATFQRLSRKQDVRDDR